MEDTIEQDVKSYPTEVLRHIVMSTNPTGRFARAYQLAKAELTRRTGKGHLLGRLTTLS